MGGWELISLNSQAPHGPGSLRMTLSPGKATLDFRAVDGELLDRGRATRQGAS
jgi:hypothetical protein